MLHGGWREIIFNNAVGQDLHLGEWLPHVAHGALVTVRNCEI